MLCYALRSKRLNLLSRDPGNREMKVVGTQEWVFFEKLPVGVSEDGDVDFSVRVVDSDEDLAAIEADNARARGEKPKGKKPKKSDSVE